MRDSFCLALDEFEVELLLILQELLDLSIILLQFFLDYFLTMVVWQFFRFLQAGSQLWFG